MGHRRPDQTFLTETWLWEAHDLAARVSQRSNEDELEIETQFSKATRQSTYIFSY